MGSSRNRLSKKKDKMKTIRLSERANMTIGRSVKYKSVEVQLIKRKDCGGVQKAYLTGKACKTVISKKDEVRWVKAVLNKKTDDPHHAERAADIEIDDRKFLSVRQREGESAPVVVVETIKDGQKQPGLAFHLSENEWNAIQDAAPIILEELKTLTATVYAELDSRIRMYRWMSVKEKEGTVSSMGSRWEYFESDAKMEAESNIKQGEQSIIQYRMVNPPSGQRLYDVSKVFLIRNALCKVRKEICFGCLQDPPAPSQTDHMIGQGEGCLDDPVEVSDSIYDASVLAVTPMTVASLYHAVASAINIPTTGGQTQEEMSSAEIKDVVLGGMDWEEDDTEYLCRKVYDRGPMTKHL